MQQISFWPVGFNQSEINIAHGDIFPSRSKPYEEYLLSSSQRSYCTKLKSFRLVDSEKILKVSSFSQSETRNIVKGSPKYHFS